MVTAWQVASNTLVLLATADELSLAWLCNDAEAAGLRVARFHEPDLGGALTAACFDPAAASLLGSLPLALSGRREVRT